MTDLLVHIDYFNSNQTEDLCTGLGKNQSHQDFNDRTGAVVSLRMNGKEEPARDPRDAPPFLTHGADDFSSHGLCKTTTLLPQPEDQLLRTHCGEP